MPRTISFNFIVSFISRIITSGINIYIISILTHALHDYGYGQYSLVFVYLAAFSAFADLGLYSYLVRHISQYDEDQSRAIGAVFGLDLIANSIFLGFSFIMALVAPYSIIIKTGLIFGTLYVIGTSLTQLSTAVYQKHSQMSYFAVFDVIFRIIHLLFVIVLAGLSLNVLWFVGVLSLIEGLHALVVIIWLRRFAPFRFRFSLSEWRSIINESYPIALSIILVFLYFKFDTILLSFYRPTQEVALYSLSYKIMESIIFIPAMYIGLIMPQLSKAFKDSVNDARQYSKVAWNLIWFIAVPATMGIFFYAQDIIRLFAPQEFFGAGLSLKILCLAMLAIFLGNLGGSSLIAARKQKNALWIYAVAALLSIVLNILLIPHYGYLGASWTTVVVEFFVTTALFTTLCNYLRILFPMRVPVIASITMLILLSVCDYMSFGIWRGIGFCALFYMPLFMLLSGVSTKELKFWINLNN